MWEGPSEEARRRGGEEARVRGKSAAAEGTAQQRPCGRTSSISARTRKPVVKSVGSKESSGR